MTVLPEGKLDTLLIRHSVVEAELSRQLPPEQFVKLSREFAEIDPVVAKIKAYREVASELAPGDFLLGHRLVREVALPRRWHGDRSWCPVVRHGMTSDCSSPNGSSSQELRPPDSTSTGPPSASSITV